MNSSREAGQSTVELALVLPVLALLALLMLQVALVARDQVLVTHAAREAARAAAVDAAPDAARAAAAASSIALDRRRLSVEVRGRGAPGSRLTAVVRYRCATDVPIVGPLVPDVPLSARAIMRTE